MKGLKTVTRKLLAVCVATMMQVGMTACGSKGGDTSSNGETAAPEASDYTSFEEYEQMIETELVKDMKAKAEEKGIKILALDYIFGFRSVISNKTI